MLLKKDNCELLQKASPWIRWTVTFLWMLTIFLFSSQPHSAGVTAKIFGDWNVIVRKSGHFTEYAILFLLYRWSLEGHMSVSAKLSKKALTVSAISLCLTVLYAASDEWHQAFVPGRGSSIYDVMLDSSGGIAAWLVQMVAP